MIVFANLPKDPDEYTVEAAGSGKSNRPDSSSSRALCSVEARSGSPRPPLRALHSRTRSPSRRLFIFPFVVVLPANRKPNRGSKP